MDNNVNPYRYSVPEVFDADALHSFCVGHDTIAEIDGDRMEAALFAKGDSHYFIALVKIK